MKISLSLKSANKKTGNIPQTYSSSSTCPVSCPNYGDAGCYASVGHTGMHWKKVDSGERGMGLDAFLSMLSSVPVGALWRHNIAGDITDGVDVDVALLDSLVAAQTGRVGFTYTHAPLKTAEGRQAVLEANHKGFTVNLSADSLAEADTKANLQIAPVVVVVPSNPSLWPTVTPEGRKVVVCPNVTHGVTCKTCKLCARASRTSIVAFPAHGQNKGKIDARLS